MLRSLVVVAALAVASASAQSSRPAVRRDQASVQFMITQSMKEDLRLLGYSSADIAALLPERAAAIIDRQIACPSQGMPASWKRGGGGGRRAGGGLAAAVGGAAKLAGFGLATALALHFSGTDLGEASRYIDAVVSVLVESTRR